jgi:D-methionine transport system ATP-binding protein
VIELAGLAKTYGTPGGPVEALRGVDLRIERGEIFGIIGRSGAGKSTLLRCINLLERPTAGSVSVDGIALLDLDARALRDVRRRIGMIFQHFALLTSRTVAQNVALPLRLAGQPRAEIDAAVARMLEFVGLGKLRDAYPAQLSGGQAQRVGIARALVSQPQVLLCDEATSALDPETTLSILALLRDVNRTFGVTIVLITHEMQVIKNVADRVAVIDAGRIVETGDVREIFLRPQAPITRTLVGEPTDDDLAAMLGAPLGPSDDDTANAVWRLGFAESSARESVVTALVRRFALDVNIVSGSIEHVGGRPLGQLVVEVTGSRAARGDALAYLDAAGVQVESLGYVGRRAISLT